MPKYKKKFNYNCKALDYIRANDKFYYSFVTSIDGIYAKIRHFSVKYCSWDGVKKFHGLWWLNNLFQKVPAKNYNFMQLYTV